MKRNLAAIMLAVVFGVVIARVLPVLADGAPTQQPLFYAGILEDGGELAEGSYAIKLTIYDAETDGDELCDTETLDVPVEAGRFRLDASACADELRATPNAWVGVSFTGEDGVPRDIPTRTKIGAVPYALEADHAVVASSASGTLAQQVVPAGLIGMFAGACPTAWSPCDGTGGRPDLNGAYVKGGAAFAAASGANTHSHSVASANTGSTSGGTPSTSSIQMEEAGEHNHVAMTDYSGSYIYENASRTFLSGSGQVDVPTWGSNYRTPSGGMWTSSSALTDAESGPLTTIEPAHTHDMTISFNALTGHSHSVASHNTAETNHEPRHATLVFCMKD